MMSFLNRILAILRPTPSPANDEDELLEDLRDYVRLDVATGFYDWPGIVAHARDYFGADIDRRDLQAAMRLAFDQATAARHAEQADWPDLTDCDRLDAAFTQLEATGMIARHHFQCCQSCANYAMLDEIDAYEAADRPWRGLVYYHEQDTESALNGEGIHLAYDAAEESDEAAVAIGHEIVACIESHGLETQWNGDILQRIHVALDWKRRHAAIGA